MAQFHWDPAGYMALMRAEVPAYDDVQAALVAATAGVPARRILELGTGTGETTRRVLDAHPEAEGLLGIDASEEMLAAARGALGDLPVVELRPGRLEDPLPPGPFDLIVSALAVHHLDGPGKAGLFGRLAGLLASGGRVVIADVVIPDDPADAVTPLDAGYDFPSRADEQIAWLNAAGLADPRVTWSGGDLAVLAADGDA